jgi:hypothetical protein
MIDAKRITLLLSTGLITLLMVLLLRGQSVQTTAAASSQAQAPSAQTAEDQDRDGLPDAWETAHGLNPRIGRGINGADGDPDRDGLSNADEYLNGTDPQNPDTDGDGLPDQWEVENLLDPLHGDGINGPDGDPDNDGLLNRDEMLRKTDPLNWDSDGDGMPDGYEVIQGLKANDNRGNDGAKGHRNGNRETNIEEFERLNDDFSPPAPVALPPQAGR